MNLTVNPISDIEYSSEVEQALEENRPILVLESTIITHGMPYPDNYKTGLALENICRDRGVTPATIAIWEGKIQIGLEGERLRKLSMNSGLEKISIKDISWCLSQKKSGGTTVAGTSFIAQLVGLEVFATGGIGGVHRGVSSTWDISADLDSLKKNHVIVVSAGVKAILDIPKTLEVLETFSVPVYGYKTDDFPAFYSSKSGCKVRKVDSVKEIAEIWAKQKSLNLMCGMLVGNPISSNLEIPADQIENEIIIALKDAENKGIKGKDISPYLLDKLLELTKGKSLKTNIELVKNNVSLGCLISQEVYKK